MTSSFDCAKMPLPLLWTGSTWRIGRSEKRCALSHGTALLDCVGRTENMSSFIIKKSRVRSAARRDTALRNRVNARLPVDVEKQIKDEIEDGWSLRLSPGFPAILHLDGGLRTLSSRSCHHCEEHSGVHLARVREAWVAQKRPVNQ
jgi:hypothetical protein